MYTKIGMNQSTAYKVFKVQKIRVEKNARCTNLYAKIEMNLSIVLVQGREFRKRLGKRQKFSNSYMA